MRIFDGEGVIVVMTGMEMEVSVPAVIFTFLSRFFSLPGSDV